MKAVTPRVRQALNLLAILFITALYFVLGTRLTPHGGDPPRPDRGDAAGVVETPRPEADDAARPYLELARVYWSLDRRVEAADAYREYLARTTDTGDAAARQEAKTRLRLVGESSR